MERHEREMARIRELERIQMESFNNINPVARGYGNGNPIVSHMGYGHDPYRSIEFDNTQSYRSGGSSITSTYTNPVYPAYPVHSAYNTNYGDPIRNNLYYGNPAGHFENYVNPAHSVSRYERENDISTYNKPQKQPVKRSWIEEEDEENELYFRGGGRKKKIEEEVYEPSQEIVDDPIDSNASASDLNPWSSDTESSDFEEDSSKKKSKATAPPSISKPKAYAPKVVDLDAPTITKLPPNPIPNTWAHRIHNPLKAIQKQSPTSVEILTRSIARRGWLEGLTLRNPVQGILMKPPFHEEKFTIKNWARFMQKILPTVMQDGYLFIWVERDELADVIRAADKYLGFKYVENLCWIRRTVGNRLMREAPKDSGKPVLFHKSKMTLLILRRDPNNICKLRHQRNPDCIFDFVGPGRMPDGRVYDVIETLLDGTKLPGPHLMHLWAGNSPTDRLVYQTRKHWIRVLEIVEDEEIAGDDEIIKASEATSVDNVTAEVQKVADEVQINEAAKAVVTEQVSDNKVEPVVLNKAETETLVATEESTIETGMIYYNDKKADEGVDTENKPVAEAEMIEDVNDEGTAENDSQQSAGIDEAVIEDATNTIAIADKLAVVEEVSKEMADGNVTGTTFETETDAEVETEKIYKTVAEKLTADTAETGDTKLETETEVKDESMTVVEEVENFTPESMIESNELVDDESDATEAKTFSNVIMAEDDLETELPETENDDNDASHGVDLCNNFHDNIPVAQLTQDFLDSANFPMDCIDAIETIVNETLRDIQPSQDECKIPDLTSSTFDEDFCNFITCDPLSNG